MAVPAVHDTDCGTYLSSVGDVYHSILKWSYGFLILLNSFENCAMRDLDCCSDWRECIYPKLGRHMHIQSTLALRTPRYHGHPLTADGSQPPGITHKEMTERNSRYYWISLLRKREHFYAPPVRHFTRSFFHCNWHSSASSKILTHVI